MKYFEKFVSNTLAACGNQSFFTEDGEKIITGRVYCRVFAGGKFPYSLLYSNIMDSTYSDGSHSHKNLVCDEWTIHSIKVGVTNSVEPSEVPSGRLTNLTVDGNFSKTVAPGEFFSTDPVTLDAQKGQYICIEISFSGKTIPFHQESVIPIFRLGADGWTRDVCVPVPGMVGCAREVEKRVLFMGDSITQGCGTEWNSYTHFGSVIADKIGEKYAFWDIGIGYGRADDAASDGAWLYKAKQNDVAIVCYGVNDIYQGFTAAKIVKNLGVIVDKLNERGIKVILQTPPPFDYAGANLKKWHYVNKKIKTELANRVYAVIDTVPILARNLENPQFPAYGGHPNAEGHRKWAEKILPTVLEALKD